MRPARRARSGPIGQHPGVARVPPSASAHPPTGKHGYPLYHPPDVAAWRAWLEANHDRERGVWCICWRAPSGREALSQAQLVEEALCVGWIDSTARVFDEDRRLQLVTPRKPKSSWTRLNRQRVAALEAAGRMTDAGRRAVEVAKANGYWTLFDSVEDLVVPDDLASALDAARGAREVWDAWPRSVRKPALWSLLTAARPETRAARIERVVAAALAGRRPG